MYLSIHSVLFALFALLATFSLASTSKHDQQAIIVSYPDSTPDSVMTEAKDAILKAGGEITHEYSQYNLVHQAPMNGG